MTLLRLESQNPNFSYVISKNPVTIKESKTPFTRSVRKGNVYGWFSGESSSIFSLLFIDSPVNVSFSSKEFEYLDKSRYSNPYVPIAIIANALSSVATNGHELDTDYPCNVSFNISAKKGLIHRCVSLQGLNIAAEELCPGFYHVIISGNKIQSILGIANLVCVLASIEDYDTFVKMDEPVVRKYLRALNACDAPYYLRYLFISRAVTSPQLFDKLKDDIQTEGMSIVYGNTQVQRKNAIVDALDPANTSSSHLVDIGCGELYHSAHLAKHYEYVLAFEGDQIVCDFSTNKILKKKLETITLNNISVDKEYVQSKPELFEGADVLLAEVIEHMDKEDALGLVISLLETDLNTLIITLPNKDFNVNYAMEETELRHPDHKWEPTGQEWTDFIISTKNNGHLRDVVVSSVGDVVGGAPSSILTSFKRVKNDKFLQPNNG